MKDLPQRIDLHMHTFLSDGVLLPSEMVRHAVVKGHRALAITDHADASNLEWLAERLLRFIEVQGSDWPLQILAGIELTHVMPRTIGRLAEKAKSLGISLVAVHGETPVEPVVAGTNAAAVECPFVDLLAHPGFLTLDEAQQAEARGIHIELSARGGHSLTNGHVAQISRQAGARLLVNTDAHGPRDLIDQATARKVAAAAGLTGTEIERATVTNPHALVARLTSSSAR